MKTGRKSSFWLFLENFDKKSRFLARALPLSLYILAPKAPLEKFKAHSAKKGFPKKYQKGDPLGGQGVEFLKRGCLSSRPPKSAPDSGGVFNFQGSIFYKIIAFNFFYKIY